VAKFIPVEPEKWAEMVKAQAEVERLNVQVETLRNLGIKLESMIDPLVSENARLKAEVERLTNLKSGADYFKAKEGKQS
jgi:hypothetical protein